MRDEVAGTVGQTMMKFLTDKVVELLASEARSPEIFRQIKAPNRRHAGSILRFGNAELAEKVRPRRGLPFATGC